jgi:hypothetical protein
MTTKTTDEVRELIRNYLYGIRDQESPTPLALAKCHLLQKARRMQRPTNECLDALLLENPNKFQNEFFRGNLFLSVETRGWPSVEEESYSAVLNTCGWGKYSAKKLFNDFREAVNNEQQAAEAEEANATRLAEAEEANATRLAAAEAAAEHNGLEGVSMAKPNNNNPNK